MNDFFEKTLEDIVFENKETVHERGFPVFYKNAKRQFLLPSGRKADIFTWEVIEGVFYGKIIEFKREEITSAAYFQVIDYYTDLTVALCGYYKNIYLTKILVGTKICQDVKNAAHCHKNLLLYEYSYSFSGVKFEQVGVGADKIAEMIVQFQPDEDFLYFNEALKGANQTDPPNLL